VLPSLRLPVALLLALCATATAQLAPVTGLNSLTEIPHAQLSHHDRNPLGLKALALNPQEWKHAETEHFIYHFQKSYVATPVSVEAEFHFRVIAKELGQTAAAWPHKAHIYIFERPADWESFQSVGGLEPWTGGIQSGSSLFIVRNPAYKFTDNSLGHEIVHLLVRRWYGERIPLWLNEGLAQYLSKNAHASYLRARGYRAKPSSSAVAAEKFIPLTVLATMSYPPADQVDAFYDQSERLARFLAAADKPKFLELLGNLARGEAFHVTVPRLFSAHYSSMAVLEERFRAYAVTGAATSEQ
jgi:hypothetical protein